MRHSVEFILLMFTLAYLCYAIHNYTKQHFILMANGQQTSRWSQGPLTHTELLLVINVNSVITFINLKLLPSVVLS